MRNVLSLVSRLQTPLRCFTTNSLKCTLNTSDEPDFVKDTVEDHAKERTINEVRLLGRVLSDPFVSQKTGKEQVEFTVGTQRRVSGKEESIGEWHHVYTSRTDLLNDVVSNVKKGHRVYISGKLAYYRDPYTNGKRTGILAFNVIKLS